MISFSAIGRCPLRPPPFNLRLWLGILRGALDGLKCESVLNRWWANKEEEGIFLIEDRMGRVSDSLLMTKPEFQIPNSK